MSAQAANSTIIELNGTYHAFFTPNDLLFGSQQQMPAIFASAAWDISPARGNGVIVAVVDSGVNAAHPDLVGRVLPGYDFVNDLPNAMDVYGHGTHVAGIIAATQNNLKGISGIAPNAKILPVRVLDENGIGLLVTIAQGIIYAADHAEKIINLSLCGPDYSSTIDAAIQYAMSKNVTVVIAAGKREEE